MSELYLDPDGFQNQIDSFATGTSTIKALSYSLDDDTIKLQCIERYMECVNQMNSTITLLSALLEQDTQSMKEIKAKWMNLDTTIATKTLGELLFG